MRAPSQKSVNQPFGNIVVPLNHLFKDPLTIWVLKGSLFSKLKYEYEYFQEGANYSIINIQIGFDRVFWIKYPLLIIRLQAVFGC